MSFVRNRSTTELFSKLKPVLTPKANIMGLLSPEDFKKIWEQEAKKKEQSTAKSDRAMAGYFPWQTTPAPHAAQTSVEKNKFLDAVRGQWLVGLVSKKSFAEKADKENLSRRFKRK